MLLKTTTTATKIHESLATAKTDGLSNEMNLHDSRDNVGPIHMHPYIKYTLKWSNPHRSVHIFNKLVSSTGNLLLLSFFVLIGEKGRNLFMNDWQQPQQQKNKSPESTFFQIKMLRHPYLHIWVCVFFLFRSMACPVFMVYPLNGPSLLYIYTHLLLSFYVEWMLNRRVQAMSVVYENSRLVSGLNEFWVRICYAVGVGQSIQCPPFKSMKNSCRNQKWKKTIFVINFVGRFSVTRAYSTV